jgi:hypothetical protein
MDPLTIISSITGLVAVSAHLSLRVAGFVGDFRAAPSAIVDLSKELSALHGILGQLEGTLKLKFGSQLPFSPALALSLQEVLNNCDEVFQQLQHIMQKFEKHEKGETLAVVLRNVRWVFTEKEVMKIRGSLERHKATLNVTLLLVVKYVVYLWTVLLKCCYALSVAISC